MTMTTARHDPFALPGEGLPFGLVEEAPAPVSPRPISSAERKPEARSTGEQRRAA